MKKYKNKMIAGVVIALVLAFVFWWGGDAPDLRGWNPNVNQVQTKAPSKALKNDMGADSDRNEEQQSDDISVKKEEGPATEENKPQNADNSPMTAEEKIALAEGMTENVTSNVQSGNADYSEQNGMDINVSTG